VLEESIYQHIIADAAIFAKTGNRVYMDCPTDLSLPMIIYKLISEFDIETLTDQDKKLIASTFQFDCYSKDRHEAKEIAKLVLKTFKNFSGEMGGTIKTGISATNKLNRFSGTDKDTKTGQEIYIETVELMIWNYEK
jgi:hypothetical protein